MKGAGGVLEGMSLQRAKRARKVMAIWGGKVMRGGGWMGGAHIPRTVSMVCAGLGPAHLRLFLARVTILGVVPQGRLLGMYGICGGTLGGKPTRGGTTSTGHITIFPP